jgi:hypothetical protein
VGRFRAALRLTTARGCSSLFVVAFPIVAAQSCSTRGLRTCLVSSGSTELQSAVSSNQASATRNYSAAISSAYPAPIRIDSPPCRNIVEAPTVGHREERDSVYLPK